MKITENKLVDFVLETRDLVVQLDVDEAHRIVTKLNITHELDTSIYFRVEDDDD